MSKIPGLGAASVVGAIGALVYSEAKMNANIKACEKDPKQVIIEKVLCKHYSLIDMIHIGNDVGCTPNEAYQSKVGKWCYKFDVPFNPRICVMIGALNNMDKTTSRSDDDIENHIQSEIEAYDKAKQEAVEAFNALPWHKQVNWYLVIYVGLAILGFILWGLGLT